MSSEPRHRRRAPGRGATLLSLLAVLPLLLTAACGKQGDPQPPLRYIPQTADDVDVQQRGHTLLLDFPYPKTTTAGMALEGLQRVEVYEVVRPVSTADRDLVDPDWPGPESGGGEVDGEAPDAGGPAAGEPGSQEPPEPADDLMIQEVGIGGADEVDQAAARREVSEEMAEASAETQGESEGESRQEPQEVGDEEAATADDGDDEAAAGEAGEGDEAVSPAVLERRRRNRMLRPLDDREFELAAELRATLAGDDLTAAVVGDRIQVRLPLPRPLPEDPRIHYLAVRTVSDRGDTSALSKQARIVPLDPPPAPREIRAEARGDGIQISWEPQGPEIVGYNLYRRNARFRNFENPVAVPTAQLSTYLDRTARIGETYIYTVTAVAQRRPLVESEVAEVREVDYRDRFPPPSPRNAVALAEDGRVRVVWQGSEADDLAGYLVWRRAGEAGEAVRLTPEPLTVTEYVDTDVEPGTTYTYRVAAMDDTGNESEAAEATTVAR